MRLKAVFKQSPRHVVEGQYVFLENFVEVKQDTKMPLEHGMSQKLVAKRGSSDRRPAHIIIQCESCYGKKSRRGEWADPPLVRGSLPSPSPPGGPQRASLLDLLSGKPPAHPGPAGGFCSWGRSCGKPSSDASLRPGRVSRAPRAGEGCGPLSIASASGNTA